MNAAFRLMLIIMFGYAVAVFAAPFFVLAVHTVTAMLSGNPPPVGWNEVPGYLGLGMTLTGAYAALPFLAAIAAMRAMKRFDWLSHASAGTLTAYCALLMAFGTAEDLQLNRFAVLAGGAGAGVVYWRVRRHFGWLSP